MQRIRMPDGYTNLCIEGINYSPDESGAFTIPDAHAQQFIHSVGAKAERAPADLEALAIEAEAHAAAVELVYKQAVVDAKNARAASDAARLKKSGKAEKAAA